MYYEEKIINDVLHWRGIPNGTWKARTPEQLTAMLLEARDNTLEVQTEGKFGYSGLPAEWVHAPISDIVNSVKKLVNMKPGWHKLEFSFELDESLAKKSIDELKVISFGNDREGLIKAHPSA